MSSPVEKQLRHLFTVSSGATPKSGKAEYWDGDIRWATPQDISGLEGYWLRDTRRKITQSGHESCGAATAPPGAILLTKRAPIGELAVLAREACSNQGCFLLTPRCETETRFFYYWLCTETEYLQVLGRGSTFMELSTDDLKALRAPHPSLPRQRAIADYLDRETARIDGMVAAKQRVLGLLAEKRRALITRAVTRGLDSNAPLRASGISWLGEIPAHWEVWKVGHYSIIGNGSTPRRENAGYWADGSIPWLNSSVVNQDQVNKADQFVTETAVRECHLPLVKAGSVLIGITGQGKTRGQAVVLLFPATINQHLAFMTPKEGLVDPWFLRWILFAAYDFLRSISDGAGGTKGALTCEEVSNVRTPVPPIDEQRVIVAHLAGETAKLDALSAATAHMIALLKERRASLIVAAVTGALDMVDAT